MDRIADYTLIRPLGEGNHGTFHLAEPPPRLGIPDEYVAVKVWSLGTTDAAFDRAVRELQAFSAVQSPYLVTLYDAGQEGSIFYYSMEYFPLGSLAAPARPLSRTEVLQAVAQGARAAHALHQAGLVHRDIKPANILLAEDRACLSDLGLARFIAPGMTVTGMGSLASVEYVEPAILAGERPSRASDIWSLGITLHRVLAGTGVYGELSDSDPLLAVRTVQSHAPALSPSLSAGERALVAACLDPNAAGRPLTAEVVADRIDALVEAR